MSEDSTAPGFNLPIDVSNETLENIYQRLHEEKHEEGPSVFYGPLWFRACDVVSDDGIVGWKLNKPSDYFDATTIAVNAAEVRAGPAADNHRIEDLELCDAVIEAHEAGETDVEVFEQWRRRFVLEDSVFVNTTDRAEITLTVDWITDYLGIDSVDTETPGEAEQTVVPGETVAKWVVLIWTVIFHLVDNRPGRNSRPLLDGVSNENFLRGLDEFLSIDTYPFVSAPGADPLWLLEAGYSAYDYDPETDTGRVYHHQDYAKASESSVFKELPAEWRLKLLGSE